jgi:Ger(x)C family germination protein
VCRTYKKKERKKVRKVLLILTTIILMTISIGCWDWNEIETRGFVLGVAIDSYPPTPDDSAPSPQESSQGEERPLEMMQPSTGKPIYAMTIQFPIIAKAQSSAQQGGSGGGGGEGSRTWEITQVGNSFAAINREISARTTLNAYYGHLQVIIISEDVAKQGIHKVLDIFVRNPESRRRAKLFICEGKAKKILDVQPRIHDYSAIYLAKIPMNATENSRMLHKVNLGEAITDLHSKKPFMLPKVMATKDEAKVTGAAVFNQEGKMVGWLNELEVESSKFIKNLYRGGVATAKCPIDPEATVVLGIMHSDTKIIPKIQNGEPSFHIEIAAEGHLAERVGSLIDLEITIPYVNKAEKAFEEAIKKQCLETIKNVQDRFGTDIFGFDTILKTKEPAYWKQVVHRWHEIFPEVNVTISAKVKITHIGTVK